MLSAEDSVSGLNLVMATHIILVHPFYHGKDKEDESIAAEKQGIARAYRSGLEHPLKVVRLITRQVDTKMMTV
jgi:SNF2 family DNA or RNA helicase